METQINALGREETEQKLGTVKGWTRAGVHIEKEFKFEDFAQALLFVNAVGYCAERANHHPDIVIHYNKVKMILWTHVASGLTENDFKLAAKIDQIAGI